MTAIPTHSATPGNRGVTLSPVAARILGEASAALRNGQPEKAEIALTGALALAPQSMEVQRLLGVAQQMAGKHAQAAATLQEALMLEPEDAMAHMVLGSALYDDGQVEPAFVALQRACELAPELPAAWFNLGKMLELQARAPEACDALQRALRLEPAHVGARMVLATAQTSVGDVAAATANYRHVLRLQPGNAKAWIGLANLKTESFDKTDTARLQRALEQPGLPVDARVSLAFALANALEDQDNYPAAFKAFGRANALKRRHFTWDATAEHAEVDAIMRTFPAPLPDAEDAALGRNVIFLVSLPRSGSTLVEQILASHPDVTGGSELTDLQQTLDDESARRQQPFSTWAETASATDWARLGRDYLARTGQHQDRLYFTDKNVRNWRLVGAAMAMLPGAKVVNCRRDALETCLGCYRQLFRTGNYFSYDLGEMAAYWHDYDRLSRHWRQLFTERFFEHDYELLLADPEAQVRRLLAFCGLEYDPACLDFHRTERVVRTASAAQVRQPLYRQTPRSALYGSRLEPLRKLLAADATAS